MSASDPARFDREWSIAVYEFVTGDYQREKAADARNAALIRVHEAGWKAVATALRTGLDGIAEAIRSRR